MLMGYQYIPKKKTYAIVIDNLDLNLNFKVNEILYPPASKTTV